MPLCCPDNSVETLSGCFRNGCPDAAEIRKYKRKSRLYPRTIWVTGRNGKKLKKVADEKQVIFYSEKYAKRAKAERAKAIAKAMDIIENPAKYC
jgi:hypothetical protein